MAIKTPYVPHIFGAEVDKKLRNSRGWLTAGVASSIPWPSYDVCIVYDNEEYFLRGTGGDKEISSPCITVAHNTDNDNEAIEKIYRLTSALSWFHDGYVDVSGYMTSSHPIRYASRHVYSSIGIVGEKAFNCNHLPVIEDENARRALAFWREGRKLEHIHDGYAFLSFFKVIESQFANSKKRTDWITLNIEKLTDKAKERVESLRAEDIDVSKHLYESCRCAVAHASLEGVIIDPDIAADKRRLSQDLVIIEGLAQLYISEEIKVPTSRSLYATRNRLAPWNELLPAEVSQSLKDGTGKIEDLASFVQRPVSVGLWPDGIISGLKHMTMHVQNLENGEVILSLINDRQTICLTFLLNYKNGRAEALLEHCGLINGAEISEDEVRTFYTFFYKTFANGIVELTIEGKEPIECETYIPTNIMMRKSVEQAIEDDVKSFQDRVSKNE